MDNRVPLVFPGLTPSLVRSMMFARMIISLIPRCNVVIIFDRTYEEKYDISGTFPLRTMQTTL